MPVPATALPWWIAGVDVGEIRHAVVFYGDVFRWDPAPAEFKRQWTLDQVRDGVALFSIASIFNGEDGPCLGLVDAHGKPIAAREGR